MLRELLDQGDTSNPDLIPVLRYLLQTLEAKQSSSAGLSASAESSQSPLLRLDDGFRDECRSIDMTNHGESSDLINIRQPEISVDDTFSNSPQQAPTADSDNAEMESPPRRRKKTPA